MRLICAAMALLATSATSLNDLAETPIVKAKETVPWSDKSILPLSVAKYESILKDALGKLNRDFLKTSATEFENYCTLETI